MRPVQDGYVTQGNLCMGQLSDLADDPLGLFLAILGMIKDRRACEPLAELLRENENSSYMLRSAIKEALTKIGEDREN